MIVRSGVEFWPGLIAALTWLLLRVKREHVPVAVRLAALVPAGLVAWACYEATCLLRDGCPGPASKVGLRPDGLATRMFPIGMLVAVAAVGAAVVLDRSHRSGLTSVQVVVLGAMAVAGIRAIASFWLPHIGDRLTRQHRESIVAFVLCALLFMTLRVRSCRPSTKVAHS